MIELSPTQHALSIEDVGALAKRLTETTTRVSSSLREKERALAWRYEILGPMWAFIVIFAMASYIKYRRLKAAFVKPLQEYSQDGE